MMKSNITEYNKAVANTLQDKINNAATSQFHALFPSSYNANKTLFGGEALKWMDEVAYITATRFTREKAYTANIDYTRFYKPIVPESIIQVTGKIDRIEKVKLYVKVEVFAEDMYSEYKEKAIEGVFIMTLLNENGRLKKLTEAQTLNDLNITLPYCVECNK